MSRGYRVEEKIQVIRWKKHTLLLIAIENTSH